MTEFVNSSEPSDALSNSPSVESSSDQSSAGSSEIIDFVENPYSAPAARLDDSTTPRSALIEDPDTIPKHWYYAVFEAFMWCFGTLSVHIGGGVAVAIMIVIVQLAVLKMKSPNFQSPDVIIWLMAGEMSIFVVASMIAITARYWGRTFKELNFSPPTLGHFLVVIFGTLPLTFCISAWALPIQLGWHWICEEIPGLKQLDQLSSMEAVKEIAKGTPLYLMILIVAVMPAIGEEIVFRGAIGRVSIAHLGLWGGVLFTSILFGCFHIHPVHALSVIPLGFAIHLVYLWTRSFWIPMLLHFANNTWASIVAQAQTTDLGHDGMHFRLIDGIEMSTGLIAVILWGIALWQSRVRLFHADGAEYKSPQFPLRVPSSPDLHRRSATGSLPLWAAGAVCVLICHAAVIYELWIQPLTEVN